MLSISQDFKGSMKAKVVAIILLAVLASILGSYSAAGSCNMVTGDLAFADKDVIWNIENRDIDPITICSISLKWPAQNGDLLGISLNTPTIFNQNRHPTEATIDSGWTGQESKRTINPKETSIFKLTFTNTASTIASDYDINVNFCPCSVEYPLSPTSACSIIGPDMVCEFDNSWYNASMNEASPFRYDYSWKVDDIFAGSGKSVQINWRPYSSGIHELFLNVSQTSGSNAYYNQSRKQVQVVKKPIVKITILT